MTRGRFFSILCFTLCFLSVPVRGAWNGRGDALFDEAFKSPHSYFFSLFDWEAKMMLEGGKPERVYGLLHTKIDSAKNDAFAKSYIRALGNGHYLMVRSERNRVLADLVTVSDWNVRLLSQQDVVKRSGRRISQGKNTDDNIYVLIEDEWGNVKSDAQIDLDGVPLKWNRRYLCHVGQFEKKKGWLIVSLDGLTRYYPIVKYKEEKYKDNTAVHLDSLQVIPFFSSERYQNGDTVRFKFYVKSYDGKLFNKPLGLTLVSETDYPLQSLKMTRPGVYVGYFVISDSMVWHSLSRKDKFCDILIESNGEKQIIRNAFWYDANSMPDKPVNMPFANQNTSNIRLKANIRPTRKGRSLDVRVTKNGKAEEGADVMVFMTSKQLIQENKTTSSSPSDKKNIEVDVQKWKLDSDMFKNSHVEFLMRKLDTTGLLGRLDSVEWYRFAYPDTPMYMAKTEKHVRKYGVDRITEFAPFVFENGQQQSVHVVYVDGVPAYMSMSGSSPYSIHLIPGRHLIYVRTNQWVYDLGTLEIEGGCKNIVSIDGQRFKNKIAFTDSLSNVEKATLYPMIMNVIDADKDAYLIQINRVFKLDAGQGKDGETKVVRVGPLKPHVPTSYICGNKKIDFEYLPYSNYTFHSNKIERTIWSDTMMNCRLINYNKRQSVDDSAYTDQSLKYELYLKSQAIQNEKRRIWFPALLLNLQDSSVVDFSSDSTVVPEGMFAVSEDKLSGCKRFRIYDRFLDMAAQTLPDMDDDIRKQVIEGMNQDLDVLAFELDSLSLDYDTLDFEMPRNANAPKQIKGFLKDFANRAIPYAAIVNMKTGEMVRSDFSGYFSIDTKDTDDLSLRIVARGFQTKMLKAINWDESVKDIHLNQRFGDYVDYRPLIHATINDTIEGKEDKTKAQEDILPFLEDDFDRRMADLNGKWMQLPMTDDNGRVMIDWEDWMDAYRKKNLNIFVFVTLRDGNTQIIKMP